MSEYIHPCTTADAYHVASNLRDPDFRECTEGYGLEPTQFIPFIAKRGRTIIFKSPDGRIAGIAGVSPEKQIWMLCTPVIDEFKHKFVREAKQWIDSLNEPFLYNIVDERNTTPIKMIKWLGFTFGKDIEYGPNQLTFKEFYRVLTSPWDGGFHWRGSSGSGRTEPVRVSSS